MILNDELARTFRQKILHAIFGEDWRPERPLENVGARLQILLDGMDPENYQKRSGEIRGLQEALRLFGEAVDETNNTEKRP